MEDTRIIELFFARSERAIKETKEKYSAYLSQVAYHILQNVSDVEEILNDTYMGAWNAIPPTRPDDLKHFCQGLREICPLTGSIIKWRENGRRNWWNWMNVYLT